jgi:anti-sigma28 factor (negative regulator of flagellin synthesis)
MYMRINDVNQAKIKGLSGERNIHEDEKVTRREDSKAGKGQPNEVSELGRIVSQARVAVEKIDEVRPEKMAEVQQRIADGYYDTDEVREELVARLADRLKFIMNR